MRHETIDAMLGEASLDLCSYITIRIGVAEKRTEVRPFHGGKVAGLAGDSVTETVCTGFAFRYRENKRLTATVCEAMRMSVARVR